MLLTMTQTRFTPQGAAIITLGPKSCTLRAKVSMWRRAQSPIHRPLISFSISMWPAVSCACVCVFVCVCGGRGLMSSAVVHYGDRHSPFTRPLSASSSISSGVRGSRSEPTHP